MANPLRYVDVFQVGHVEPSVTGLIRLNESEPVRGQGDNDLIVFGPFADGQPNLVTRFRSLASLADAHDPDRLGDQGVALARIAKTGISETDMFGAADILTLRVDQATPSTLTLADGGTDLIRLATGRYGSHTRRSKCKLEDAGIQAGAKKITLRDDSVKRTFVGDNLGVLLSLEYTGDATTAVVDIHRAGGIVTYTDQPTDADIVTVNGVDFEFDDDDAVAGGNIAVTIGATADDTFAALAAAIGASVPGATASHNETDNEVVISNTEDGVILVETLDAGAKFAVAASGVAGALVVTLAGDQTDGSLGLNIPLGMTGYETLGKLATYINSQLGYSCSVNTYATRSMRSSGLDVVSGASIATALNLTGFCAAIADWVATKTRSLYTAEILAYGEPDNTTGEEAFAGGTSPMVTASDWANALEILGSNIERGGILLANTDDPAIQAMVQDFIVEMRGVGKWFRAYFGTAPGTSAVEAMRIAGSFDNVRTRLCCQRLGVLGANGATTYLDPIFSAAVLAGAAAGNLPYVKPLTNKRVRFVGIHENDDFTLETREDLLSSGVTVFRREQGIVKCVMHVTCSQDPDRRMPHLVSEVDTIDEIDALVRTRFLPYRGLWADQNVANMSVGLLTQILQYFTERGAISSGVDAQGQAQPAWRLHNPPAVINAGVLEMGYDVFIGGELDHISAVGNADYARLVASLSGNVQSQVTAVPI